MSDLAIVNMNLPARVWLPLYEFPHYVVRIPYRSAAVLNSKEKAPYIVYIEVIECDNIFSTPLTPKLLDNYLQSVKSHENLAGMTGGGSGGGNGPTNPIAASSSSTAVIATGGSGGGGNDETSETNSQIINFNAETSTAQQQPSLESTSPPKPKPSIVEPSTNPATATTTTPTGVPKAMSGEGSGLFDPNNFDRWSISSDVGPMNTHSNGNSYFRVIQT